MVGLGENSYSWEGLIVSAAILAFAREYPIVVFVVGFVLGILAGHLLWPQYQS